MAIGDEDHGRIAMAVATILAGAVHQPVDFPFSEVAPLDCQVYSAWCAFLGCRFHRDKTPPSGGYWLAYTHFLHSKTSALALSAQRQAASPYHFFDRVCVTICLAAIRAMLDTPRRGDFSVSNLHPGPIPGNLVRNDFWW